MNRFWDLPLRVKVATVYILANLLVFIVNLFLILGINSMSLEIDAVYLNNRQLNSLSAELTNVQESMTTYLTSKTSDSLEEYYRHEQNFNFIVQELGDDVTEMSFGRMERNIRNMCENYLDIVRQTIEAKRGRNVEKYRVRYEAATEQYNYIATYINALNNEQFATNSEHYTAIAKSFRLFEQVSIIVMFAVVLGNALIIIMLIKRIMNPLSKLVTAAEDIAQGNINSETLEVESRDEVGVVTEAFNTMVVSIRDYIEKLRKSMEAEKALQEKELSMETHLKDAQLRYLQAQINPHFLFNTLNAGAQLAMMEGADRTYEYVQTVADFFRYNVKKQDKPVTIGEEVTLVDNYIQILNVRFSGDIHYEKQVDERLMGVEIPSMILQPIVENCVNHGIREMGDKGVINLKIFRIDNEVCITVRDNGKGMSQEVINQLLEGTFVADPEKKESNGLGMDNVIARIRMFTDNRDAIEISSEGENKGTVFTVHIPLKNAEI